MTSWHNSFFNQFVLEFHPLKRREIRAQFDGGAITSDGGGLLLREVEKRIRILRQFACHSPKCLRAEESAAYSPEPCGISSSRISCSVSNLLF